MISTHSSMWEVESGHWPLRRIYRILTENHGALSDNIRLALTVKTLNNTTGPKGLVLSLLVFGTITQLENTGASLMDREDRFKAMQTARKEKAKIMTKQRIKTELSINVPPLQNISHTSARHQWVKAKKEIGQESQGRANFVETGMDE